MTIQFQTDVNEFAKAVTEFEKRLPGFWWSVGQCTVGAHASCAPDGRGAMSWILEGVASGDRLDDGFHCDTDRGTPADALSDVMHQAIEYLDKNNPGWRAYHDR